MTCRLNTGCDTTLYTLLVLIMFSLGTGTSRLSVYSPLSIVCSFTCSFNSVVKIFMTKIMIESILS